MATAPSPVSATPAATNCDERNPDHSTRPRVPPLRPLAPAAAAAALQDRCQLLAHRTTVEEALRESGVTQPDVMAWLADQIVDDVVSSVAAEVSGLFDTVTDTLVNSL